MNRAGLMSRVRLEVVPLALATAVIWVYVGSYYKFKAWYIAAAVALVAVGFLVVTRRVSASGLPRALSAVVVYFMALGVGATWARQPDETLRWVAIDAIEIGVVVLFFVAVRNARVSDVELGLMTFPVAGLLMAVAMTIHDPGTKRLAHYALPLMPVVVPHVVGRIARTKRPYVAILMMFMIAGLLAVGRSRAPIVASVVTGMLALVVFTRTPRMVVRKGVLLAGASALALLVLMVVPSTRGMLDVTAKRLLETRVPGQTPEPRPNPGWEGRLPGVGQQTPAENPLGTERGADPNATEDRANRNSASTRARIGWLAWQLLPESFPLGIGYMNFSSYYAQRFGVPRSLHSIYLVWLIEGGIACVAVVIWLLVRIARDVRRFLTVATSPDERAFASACLIGLAGVLLQGFVHQMHQSPALWLSVAMCSALGAIGSDRVETSGGDTVSGRRP